MAKPDPGPSSAPGDREYSHYSKQKMDVLRLLCSTNAADIDWKDEVVTRYAEEEYGDPQGLYGSPLFTKSTLRGRRFVLNAK